MVWNLSNAGCEISFHTLSLNTPDTQCKTLKILWPQVSSDQQSVLFTENTKEAVYFYIHFMKSKNVSRLHISLTSNDNFALGGGVGGCKNESHNTKPDPVHPCWPLYQDIDNIYSRGEFNNLVFSLSSLLKWFLKIYTKPFTSTSIPKHFNSITGK